jgi:hypothetical protein
MASMSSEIESQLPQHWNWGNPLAQRSPRSDTRTKFLITGAVVLGVGLFAWYYLGPDLKRYLKIHSM